MSRARATRVTAAVVATLVLLGGCGAGGSSAPSSISSTAPTAAAVPAGATPLPLRPDGFGQVLPTPPDLVDRRLPTVDRLPPPASGRYESTVSALTPDQVARSTWHPGCPVPPEQLRYLTMSFRGFDGRAHTGDMIVRQDVAAAVVGVFGRLFAAGFPLEEMRTSTPEDLVAPRTGVGNDTAAYACRPATGLSRYSAHAFGLAIDVNPFQNPYERADGLVIPELASAYTDRGNVRPGMLRAGDVVVTAFTRVGWTWGGGWTSPRDIMHFSETGD